jgi:hypothetical protein
MDKIDKLLMKKKKEGRMMSDNECEAKKKVVKSLKDFASEEMSKGLGGLKKVTVASDSPEGLKKGLEKAEDIMEDMPEGDEESPEMEMADEESSEDSMEDMSPEEIDAKIQELLDLKRKLKA